ncbi:hypothetical protein Hanom_Chr01g00064471 [Helianthus anomalus]
MFVFFAGKGLQSADHICRYLQEKRWTKCLQSVRRRGFVFFCTKNFSALLTHKHTDLSSSLSLSSSSSTTTEPQPPSSPLHHRHHRYYYTTTTTTEEGLQI